MYPKCNPPICAAATPLGHSAIGVIRATGAGTIELVSQLFQTHSQGQTFKKNSEQKLKPRHAYFGKLIENNEILDEVVLIVYAGPASYSGEDSAEIFTHGNPILMKNILGALLRAGFTPASPGEFTRRAYQNGKLDLTEAEAIHEIITARGEKELQSAQLVKAGSFRRKLFRYRSDLMNLAADLTAELDFADEDIQFLTKDEKLNGLHLIIEDMRQLLDDTARMQLFRQGLEIVIAGAPNTGKSSLLNEIIGKDRAIVSGTPGTTRDYLEAGMQIAGVPVKYVDTAGIRSDTQEETEKAGILKSIQKWSEADICILMIDLTLSIEEALAKAPGQQLAEKVDGNKILIVLNKLDCAHPEWKSLLEKDQLVSYFTRLKPLAGLMEKLILSPPQNAFLPLSILKGDGMERFQKTMEQIVENMNPHSESMVMSAWQTEILEQILEELNQASQMTRLGESPELIAASIQNTIDYFSVISGEISNEEILGRVFSRFCIGK